MIALIAAAIIASSVAGTDGAHVAPRPAYRVCGIDRTGSYTFIDAARAVCAQVLLRARPGDVVAVRWISEASYASTQQIVLLRLPALVQHPCTSAFDTQCRTAAVADQRRVAAAKQRAVALLRGAKPIQANRTDVWGFIAAAGDLFAEAPSGARRVIYVTGDFDDNVRHTVRPPLVGVEVFGVAQQTSGSPEHTQQTRARWSADLRKLGATLMFRSDMAEVP